MEGKVGVGVSVLVEGEQGLGKKCAGNWSKSGTDLGGARVKRR